MKRITVFGIGKKPVDVYLCWKNGSLVSSVNFNFTKILL